MASRLIVLLENRRAGTLSRVSGERLRFDYDDEYRSVEGATPLSLSMPVQVRAHSHAVVDPWLWNLLPDNENVLGRWAREYQASARSPFSLLATPIGEDCPGAVRFIAEERFSAFRRQRNSVTWLSEEEVAARLRALRRDATAWHSSTFTGQFSLAGAQAKTALLYRDGRWGLPSGNVATTHILKPAVVGFDEHDLNEHLSLKAAGLAGLLVAGSRIARFKDERAVVVQRFDRRTGSERVGRIHQEDLCQALGIHPIRKYQNQGGPSPGGIVSLFRAAMPQEAAEDAIWRFVDALIWNWLIAGTDAHAKNYSVLLSGTDVRLAPLYDIASALPYGIHERRLRLAMKLGGDYRLFPHRNNWPAAARDVGVDRDRLLDRVRDLASRAPSAFNDAANSPDVKELGSKLPARLVELISDRVSRCRMVVNGAGANGS